MALKKNAPKSFVERFRYVTNKQSDYGNKYDKYPQLTPYANIPYAFAYIFTFGYRKNNTIPN